LQTLSCFKCPTLITIPQFEGLRRLSFFGCKWIESNEEYDDAIKKLLILQRWFKNLLQSRRLKKLIQQLVPLYYHPDAKGGYLDKLDIMKFMNGISFKS